MPSIFFRSVVVAGLFAGAMRGQNASRNCQTASQGELSPGDYSGEFSQYAFAEKSGFREMVSFTGTLKLRVGSDGAPFQLGSATGEFTINGVGTSSDYSAATGTKLSGALASHGAARNLTLQGPLSGTFRVTAPNGKPAFASPTLGSATLNLTTTLVACGASGDFKASIVDQTLAGFQSTGFQISPGMAHWYVGPRSSGMAEMNRLRSELNQGPPPGIIRRKEAESQRLGAIADRIKAGPPEFVTCLSRIWFDFARARAAQWVAQDVSKIDAYKGDDPGFYALETEGLQDAKALCVLGLDRCLEDLHNQVFISIQAGLSRILKRLSDNLGRPEDILKTLKQAELLGDVAPGLRTRVANALIKEAVTWAKIDTQKIRTYAASHRGTSCGPELAALGAKARNDVQEVEIMDGDYESLQADLLQAMGQAQAACKSTAKSAAGR